MCVCVDFVVVFLFSFSFLFWFLHRLESVTAIPYLFVAQGCSLMNAVVFFFVSELVVFMMS